MKAKIPFQNSLIAVLGLIGLTAVSCKKNNDIPVTPPVTTPVPTTGSRAQLTQDSIFLYAKEVYLWNTSLPDYATFNPRQYAQTLAGYNQELYTITQYSPVNTATGKPYEYPLSTDAAAAFDAKYSYIDDISKHNVLATAKDQKSSVDLEGVGNDLGFKLGAYRVGSSAVQYAIYIQAVYQGSPADLKGLTRGATITKINGVTFGANLNSEADAIDAALNGSSVTIAGVLKDGITSYTYTLAKTTYSSSPIYSAKVLSVSGNKIGYLSYARFSSMANSQAGFDSAFANFAASGVTKLVIDLRYNGGGYVNTAEYLVNLIAPSSIASTNVMFKERYNAMMQAGTATIMANQPLYNADGTFQRTSSGRVATYADLAKDYFSEAKQVTYFNKKGPLQGVTDVVFIVTRNTASASELVINSLKPYLNVKIVGTNSYGKPVGFFPISIEYKVDAATKKETGYDVYYSMFQTTNSKGEGDYFNGFTPDLSLSTDDASHDFGDINENNLAKALSLIVSTPLTTTSSTMSIGGRRVNSSATSVTSIRDGAEFNGMIADRPRLK
jgi:carboxyl-terminal processing protease